jgi:hypothetical protein
MRSYLVEVLRLLAVGKIIGRARDAALAVALRAEDKIELLARLRTAGRLIIAT